VNVPTREGYPEGIPCWVDLATTDVDSAKTFYESIFGWEIQEPQSEEVPYWMALKNGLPAAGIGPAPEGQPYSAWTSYLAVDDADATAATIREAGGQMITEPMDVLDAGRLAIAADPTGAVFGIWQSGEHKGAGIVNEHGALNWNELQTTDVDGAVSFYESVFGYTHRTVEGGTGPYTVLAVGDRDVAGVMTPPADDVPNNWSVYFAVDDATEARQRAQDAGGSAITETMDIPDVGTLVVLADPTGAAFVVIQLAMEID
jgi:predicted enzyme related to lactoylglutathione lyase